MFKKISWIVTLIIALSVVFVACEGNDIIDRRAIWPVDTVVFDLATHLGAKSGTLVDADYGDFLQKAGGPTVTASSGKLVLVGRTNNWDGIDIKIAGTEIAPFIAGYRFELKVVVSGADLAGIKLGQSDAPYGNYVGTPASVASPVTLTYVIAADFPTNGSQRIRIQADGGKDFTIESITITYIGKR